MELVDVLVVGAGGAGLMCAMQAARRRRKVAVLDHAMSIGRKILISGGGRCNFTNVLTDPAAYVSKNPHFCKSALSRFTPDDFIRMVKDHGIPFHEKKLGQLFCDGSAQNIVNLLVSECEKAGVRFHLNCRISRVDRKERFIVDTNRGQFGAESLVIATGGLSFPKIGATGWGYAIAGQFGLGLVETSPALVGMTGGKDQHVETESLAGVSVDALVYCTGRSIREHMLFTHRGLSGPAILQASLYWRQGETVTINLLPERNLRTTLVEKRGHGAKAAAAAILTEDLPRRVCEWIGGSTASCGPTAELSDAKIDAFVQRVQQWEWVPSGTEGYQKAEVTRGGVDTSNLSSKTMEAKSITGLFFIGEVVDVTGQLGGYNFQWAWASGWAAGQYA